ncbi:polysaccharide pyruvyl transferase family protein [Sphingobacterium hotanense]|uniref:polysaccharide pyruvyl transferase family protein n=1 Tax=Sphingobacterium hotanense TaxID=649196 RepID=UPI0021A746A4|nr:polysaccharide pyruvyl transferase family protein [Sphingobacterium hotanense]MCT1523550.1 polysaccharide pyruvyl transferase family protein [Sphingobacterium hotanense]
MKNIGLLTFHYPINYGALLQTYATVKSIEKLGNKAIVIDYYSDDQIGHYDFYKKPQSFKNFIYYIVKSLFYFSFISKRNKFAEFRKKHFNLSPHYNTLDHIDFGKYDIVLTGSDQVFNLSKRDRLPYFQPFSKTINQRKAAYAPSFGISEFDLETQNLIKRLTQDFDFLSCREQWGTSFLKELTGKNVVNVLDPVFLLSSNEWSKLIEIRIIAEDYIFIYDLNGKGNLVKLAGVIKEKYNLKTVMVSNDPLAPIKNEYKGIDVIIKSSGIEEFVNLIKFSSFVLTDSFHGTAFSIIFRKSFYTYIALEKASGRILSLLDNFEIKNRVVYKNDITRLIPSDIEYNEVAIESKIKLSKDYLESIHK